MNQQLANLPPAEPMKAGFLSGMITEQQGYKKLDDDRVRQRAVDEGKTRISESLQQMLGVDKTNDIGPGSQSPIDRRKRIDTLAGKENWKAEDLEVITDKDLAVARGARRFLSENPPAPGTIQLPGDYAIQTNPVTGDKSIEMFSTEIPFGQDVGGYKGMAMNDMRFEGAQRPGEPIRVPGYEKPPLMQALQGMTEREAVGYLANQMRLDALEKQLGYRPASL